VFGVEGVYINRGVGVSSAMESSAPVQFSNILADDYQHFEHTHEQYPQEAQAVFGRMSELRAALQAFREATLGAKAEALLQTGEPVVPEEVSAPVLLGSVDGSTEQQHGDGVVDLTADSADSEVKPLITAVAEILSVAELVE